MVEGLYKYYGPEAGLAALRSSQVGFTSADRLNDIFEFEYIASLLLEHQPGAMAQIDFLKSSIGVLSLTKNPLNDVMWAHYGRDHSGIVIKYDASDPMLADPNYNVIPASDGSVDYFSERACQHDKKILAERFGRLVGDTMLAEQEPAIFSPEDKDVLRLMFVTKKTEWAYEQEVRVVRLLTPLDISIGYPDQSGRTAVWRSDPMRKGAPHFVDTCELRSGSPIISRRYTGLHLFEKPVKILEIYVGLNFPGNLKGQLLDTLNLEHVMAAQAFGVNIDRHQYCLKRMPYSDAS